MESLLVQTSIKKSSEEKNTPLMSPILSNSYRQLSPEDDLKFRNNNSQLLVIKY